MWISDALARAFFDAGSPSRALDTHTLLLRDRGRESIVEVAAHKPGAWSVSWTARVPVGEVLIAEERGFFARVRRDVAVGDRAFDARFYLRGDVRRFVQETRHALLDLGAPVDVHVRDGHAVARLRGDPYAIALAVLLMWHDLDPPATTRPSDARGPAMHRGFAPDDLLPKASVADIDAITRAQRRAVAERAAESRRRAALFKPPPVRAPRVRAARAQPAPALRKRAARAPPPIESAPAPVRAPRTPSAPRHAAVESEPFEPILPVLINEVARDAIASAVLFGGGGAHVLHVDRVSDGVVARLDLPRGEGTLFVDEDGGRLRIRAVGPSTPGAPAFMLTPQPNLVAHRALDWLRPRRDDVVGHGALDDAFIMEIDAALDPVWLKDVAASLLALRDVEAAVRAHDDRIDVTTAWFAKHQHALTTIVHAAVTVLYASTRRV